MYFTLKLRLVTGGVLISIGRLRGGLLLKRLRRALQKLGPAFNIRSWQQGMWRGCISFLWAMIFCAHNVGKTVHQSQVAILCNTPFSYTFVHRPGNPVLVNGCNWLPRRVCYTKQQSICSQLNLAENIHLQFLALPL